MRFLRALWDLWLASARWGCLIASIVDACIWMHYDHPVIAMASMGVGLVTVMLQATDVVYVYEDDDGDDGDEDDLVVLITESERVPEEPRITAN
jgi:hypothetical protein